MMARHGTNNQLDCDYGELAEHASMNLTRNQTSSKGDRGFESLTLRHLPVRRCPCLPRKRRFFLLLGQLVIHRGYSVPHEPVLS